MLDRLTRYFDTLTLPRGGLRRDDPLHRLGLVLVAALFVLGSTVIIAFESFVPSQDSITTLQVGSIAPQDIRAPFSITYPSEVLTERQRQAAVESVSPVYDPPDPSVARQQLQLLQQILDFIDNVRHDPFGTPAQKIQDIQQVIALTLSPDVIATLIDMDDETWREVAAEAVLVLERMMRESIREVDLAQISDQVPTQVALRFDPPTAAVVVGVVQDLLRPNRFQNAVATDLARQAAAASVQPQSRSFERGQIVVRGGTRIEAADYEALDHLGLLQSPDRRIHMIGRALLASLLVMIGMAMYIARFPERLNRQTGFLLLLTGIFLLALLGARVFNGGENLIYIYPAAAMALLLVGVTYTEIAIVAGFSLAILVGLMINNSLELTTLIALGGLVGALILRRAERLNNYFLAGVVISLANVAIVTLFNLGTISSEGSNFGTLLLYALINGVLAAMTALAGMYAITLIFNLPTSLKLVELSQPSQPLLQRLLREAPGTYQHSLQVANLCEQAANAVGANAELVRVSALYHDVGKVLNPAFFVENQADNVNPHDVLNDPYRSAAIIISHVIEGEKLARQYGLPARVRDFIMEHHGTTLVSYFYSKAVEQAEHEEAVDIDQFTYPGPKPQTRESAIMMLADSCESTVRARKPGQKSEIAEIVQIIFDNRMRDGQLDECDLTLRDLDKTREIFIEMLQAVFHPRINYPAIPTGASRRQTTQELVPEVAASVKADVIAAREAEQDAPIERADLEAAKRSTVEISPAASSDNDDSPLLEVPPLRRTQRMTPVERAEVEGERPQDDDVSNRRTE